MWSERVDYGRGSRLNKAHLPGPNVPYLVPPMVKYGIFGPRVNMPMFGTWVKYDPHVDHTEGGQIWCNFGPTGVKYTHILVLQGQIGYIWSHRVKYSHTWSPKGQTWGHILVPGVKYGSYLVPWRPNGPYLVPIWPCLVPWREGSNMVIFGPIGSNMGYSWSH